MQLAIRFVVGGIVVSLFAVIGDVLQPKSFAGLFSAAPSVALATLGLTMSAYGKLYASIEGRSMIAGAIALFLYSCLAVCLIAKFRLHAGAAAAVATSLWLICAVGGWGLFLR
jgi:hypothetical protein